MREEYLDEALVAEIKRMVGDDDDANAKSGDRRDSKQSVRAANERPPQPEPRPRTITVTVDHTLFMFCYPWRPHQADRYPDPRYTRQPLPNSSDQSNPAYGRWSFDLAGRHAVDVLVGFWTIQKGRQDIDHPVYAHFMNSISWHTGAYNGPKIAISMSFEDARHPLVAQQIERLRNIEFPKERYYKFRDRKNQLRIPVFFWGLDAIFSPESGTPDLAKIKALGERLARLRQPLAGATPFLVWEGQMLRQHPSFFYNPAYIHLASSFRENVLDKLDGFYQHECHIPSIRFPFTRTPPRWQDFPSFTFDDIDPIGKATVLDLTVGLTRDLKRQVMQPPPGNVPPLKAGGQDGLMYIIPGTFPQYSRERYSYWEYTLNPLPGKNDFTTQSRVKCTDPRQLRRLFHVLRAEATSIHTTKTAPHAITSRRMIALTSWDEWPEGTTWQYCQPDSNDASVFGLTDSAGDFLNEVKGALDKYQYRINVGGGDDGE